MEGSPEVSCPLSLVPCPLSLVPAEIQARFQFPFSMDRRFIVRTP